MYKKQLQKMYKKQSNNRKAILIQIKKFCKIFI